MFKEKSSLQSHEETKVGASVTLEGDFEGEGNVNVEGTVKGSLKTKQNLMISPSAKIHASVDAQNATIAGEVKGNIKVSEKLDILATARISGDIEAKTLTVAEGASLNGKFMVGVAHETISHEAHPSNPPRQNHTGPRNQIK